MTEQLSRKNTSVLHSERSTNMQALILRGRSERSRTFHRILRIIWRFSCMRRCTRKKKAGTFDKSKSYAL